jgi:hypothetical protein
MAIFHWNNYIGNKLLNSLTQKYKPDKFARGLDMLFITRMPES